MLTTVTDAEGDEEAGGASAAAAMPQRAKKARLDMRNSRTIFISILSFECVLVNGRVRVQGAGHFCALRGCPLKWRGAPEFLRRWAPPGVTVAGPIQERHTRLAAPETVSCLCASHTWTE